MKGQAFYIISINFCLCIIKLLPFRTKYDILILIKINIFSERNIAMNIKITADSTCDLSNELVEKYSITILPLYIVKDGKSYKDGLEITPSAPNFRAVTRMPALPLKISTTCISSTAATFQQAADL